MKERAQFTKENKGEYTILIPNMLPIHFTFLCNVLNSQGYKAELLTTMHRDIVEEGLKNVHNDTCFPALLVIGQFLDALKSGQYDLDKVALMITQTSGGCRATNYISLLRKALDNNNLSHIPVISLNMSGLESNPGFKLTMPIIKGFIFSIIYGDLIMWIKNQTLPYEKKHGETEEKIKKWTRLLSDELKYKKVKYKMVKKHFKEIIDDFSSIECSEEQKVKVGIVGEIYVKFSPLGNNNLERFLIDEGAEVVTPGLIDFILYATDATLRDYILYGGNLVKNKIAKMLKGFIVRVQNDMIDAIKYSGRFTPMSTFNHISNLVTGYVGREMKMGEGWLLPAEILELIDADVQNIVCAQPFGCLPNHIVGKGMFRKIKESHPSSNIVSVDYDPGATKVNQENRIKLMLAVAKRMAH